MEREIFLSCILVFSFEECFSFSILIIVEKVFAFSSQTYVKLVLNVYHQGLNITGFGYILMSAGIIFLLRKIKKEQRI